MTAIEWTDETWNPIVGCSIVSPGCTNCYAMRHAARLEAIAGDGLDENGYAIRGSHPLDHYRGTTRRPKGGPVWTGKVALAPDSILTKLLHWKKPRRIFVNSMGDLFHESVPDEWIDRVFAVMALAPQHTFQVLTKRSARMRAYFEGRRANFGRASSVLAMMAHPLSEDDHEYAVDVLDLADLPDGRPLSNVWLGVSAEDQRRANERVPDLLATPAAVRFVSAEPLLSGIDFRHLRPTGYDFDFQLDALTGTWSFTKFIGSFEEVSTGLDLPALPTRLPRLDLIIVGGESGPKARPMHPDWSRSIRDQCAIPGVPFFFKQWGEWEVALDRDREDPDWRRDYSREFVDKGRSKWLNLAGGCGFHGERFHVMRRVGKARAGRLLDGVTHDAMPEVRHG